MAQQDQVQVVSMTEGNGRVVLKTEETICQIFRGPECAILEVTSRTAECRLVIFWKNQEGRFKRQKKQSANVPQIFQRFKRQGEKIARAGRQESIVRNNSKYGPNSKQKDSGRVSQENGRCNNWKGLKLDRIKCLERNFFRSGRYGSNSFFRFLPSSFNKERIIWSVYLYCLSFPPVTLDQFQN